MSDLEGFELSPQQKRLWPFLALRSDSPYRVQVAVLLEGVLAREVLLASLHSLLERHEILSTRFRKLPEMSLPLQIVGPADGSLSLRDADLTALDPGERESALASLLAEEREAPLDPEQGPVARVVLASLEAAQTVLVLTVSALCADGPSLSNLVRELADAYARGGELKADDAPQYADLAAWQNELVELGEASAGRTYWRQQRLEEGLATELPFEREVGELGPFRPAVFAWRLAPRLSCKVETLAADMGVPIEDVLLAAWCVLLARHTGTAMLPIGVLGDGRNYETLERAVGPLARYLLVRFEPAAGATFRSGGETLASLRRKALDYQELFSWETLNGAHGLRPPHFQLCFDFQPASEEHAAPGLRFSVLRRAACIEPCRLRLSCSADREGIFVELHYHGGAFEPSDIETLAERFTALLTSAAENPDQPVGTLAMVGPSEHGRLAALNDTAMDLPEDARLERLFERQVERSPEAVAVVLGERGLTYAELESRAAILAGHLRRLGVGPEVIVPLCVERSFEMMIGLLGILKAGGAYLPLDPGLPAERLSRLLDEINAPVLLTRTHELAALPPLRCPVVRLDEDLPETAEGAEPVSYSPDHPAYVIYTSGSTGMPKGILMSHRAICNRLLWMERSGLVGSADILLQRTRFTFDASIWEIFLPLWLGARLVLLPQEAQADASRVAQLIREEEVTILQMVPSLLRVLLEEEGFCRCTSLLRVFSGGEVLSGDLVRRFTESLPGATLVNLYGPTEAAIDATFQPCGPALERARMPIGRPLPNVEVYVVDAAIQRVPSEALGELCIGGIGLARGYVRRADLTAERFIPSPFGDPPGARLYRTGDLARLLPDGSLDFLGRMDRQVKLRGYRIELDEVEAVLRQHPGVLQAAVVLRDDAPGHPRLTAYVEVAPRSALDLGGKKLFRLPNQLEVDHLNREETMVIYEEIFEKETYRAGGITLDDGAVIFDVGANVGLFTLYLHQRVREPRVYAFEPVPSVFAILRNNVALYGLDVRLYACGLSNRSGTALFTFYPEWFSVSGSYADETEEMEIPRQILQNQFQLSSANIEALLGERFRRKEVFECPLKTLSGVIREEGIERIDLLKIDVEKSEFDVLLGLEEQDWDKVGQIAVEVHDREGRLEMIGNLLASHGFEITLEQDPALQHTGMYNLFARRPDRPTAASAPSRLRPLLRRVDPGAGELRDFAAARLPEYMVPAAIVRLPKLPLLPNGKLDRSALPPPESMQPEIRKEAIAPRNRVEECLAAIWCELLHLDEVSVHDNFFELGGDSILSIQVVARAKREGIVLVARDLFRHQTISELAQVHGTVASNPVAEQSGGFFALSPAQRQFFELDLPEPHHFNQALLLSTGEPIPLPLLTTVVAAVVSHHEALRLRFEPRAEGWLQKVSAPGDLPVSCLDLSSLPAPRRPGAVERATLALQQSLDYSKGPVFRVIQLDLGTLGSRLLLLAHHLVVDGVSWRILLEDFALLQEQVQLGRPPELPLPTTSFRSWIERLIHHVDAGALAREIPFWLALSETAAAPPPIDFGDGENTFGSEQTVSVALEPGETRILLQETLAAFRAQINDVLLTALARAFTSWTGGASLLVDIEGHGREELFEDIDLSRTVGWFTSQFPVLLDLADADGPEAALDQVKEQLRRVPNRGIGYLLLHHLSRSPELAARIKALPKSQVSFNYLGQIDQSLPTSSRLSLASEDKGREIAPSARRPFLIDVIGVVAGGQLRLQWTYSAHRHRTATIAALSERFLAELRALIERSRSVRTESYVPSEFPLAGLDRNHLGRLSSLIDRLDAMAEEGEPLDA